MGGIGGENRVIQTITTPDAPGEEGAKVRSVAFPGGGPVPVLPEKLLHRLDADGPHGKLSPVRHEEAKRPFELLEILRAASLPAIRFQESLYRLKDRGSVLGDRTVRQKPGNGIRVDPLGFEPGTKAKKLLLPAGGNERGPKACLPGVLEGLPDVLFGIASGAE
jgi:hypothetical protein